MTKQLFTKLFVTFYLLILIFVLFWQKTRPLRSIFSFGECRFYPSCSDYLLQSLRTHGLFYGFIFFVGRLIRCHPLCSGGVDEVPL